MEAAGSSDYSAFHSVLACVLFPQSLWIIILEIKNSGPHDKMMCPTERNTMKYHGCETVNQLEDFELEIIFKNIELCRKCMPLVGLT
jgi:hypothetical protein